MGKRVCAEPGCPRIVGGRRCDEHTPTQAERGYGPAHHRLRAQYQARMNAGETFRCWRCACFIDPRCWRLGHDDDDRSVYRGPECIPCNQATAGRRK